MSKAFEVHLAALSLGEITKTNVTGLRRAFMADARRHSGRSVSSTAPKATEKQLERAQELIVKRKPAVIGTLHESGLAVIRSKRNRRALADVAEIATDVVKFRLVDFEMRGRWGDYFVPIYRAETSDGRHFDFVNVPWQSGGNGPEVLSVSK